MRDNDQTNSDENLSKDQKLKKKRYLSDSTFVDIKI